MYCRVFHVEQKVLTQDELAILVEPHHIKKGFEGIKRLFFNS
jgi:hypothetical protein